MSIVGNEVAVGYELLYYGVTSILNYESIGQIYLGADVIILRCDLGKRAVNVKFSDKRCRKTETLVALGYITPKN